MVAARHMAIEEQAVQSRLARQFNSSLFLQLALQRVAERLTGFHATARQMPAGDITVLDQKYAILAVQHDGADPEGHAAGEPPIEMKNPPQHRFQALSQALQVHRQ